MQDSSTIYLGIDPGKTGALAILFPTHAEVLDTPRDEATGDIDVDEMARFVGGLNSFDHTVVATIERAQAYPRQGVSSCFNYGVGYGMWIGVLAAFRVSLFLRVGPSVWKKKMLPPDSDLKDKRESIKAARVLFPDVDLGKRRDAGRAEALLIAYYGRWTYTKSEGRF
jgi:crossover junction endodeoxyribonuclease RuvC